MSPGAFRALVLGAWCVQLASPFLDRLLPRQLSPALEQAIEAEPLSRYFDHGWFLALLTGWIVAMLASTIGLLWLKRWARSLALWVTVTGWVIYPLLGPSASSGLAGGFAEAGATLWGAALAVAYFSSLRVRFGDSP